MIDCAAKGITGEDIALLIMVSQQNIKPRPYFPLKHACLDHWRSSADEQPRRHQTTVGTSVPDARTATVTLISKYAPATLPAATQLLHVDKASRS